MRLTGRRDRVRDVHSEDSLPPPRHVVVPTRNELSAISTAASRGAIEGGELFEGICVGTGEVVEVSVDCYWFEGEWGYVVRDYDEWLAERRAADAI